MYLLLLLDLEWTPAYKAKFVQWVVGDKIGAEKTGHWLSTDESQLHDTCSDCPFSVHWASSRYVGVIRSNFHVLQLQPIRVTKRNLCCISKSSMKRQPKNRISNQSSVVLVYVYEKCMFVDSSTKYICKSSQLWSSGSKFWRCSPISLKCVSMVLVLRSSPIKPHTAPIKQK